LAKINTPALFGELVHLNLRGRLPRALVQDEADWHVLGAIADRMVFWCGGSIHGCRCEGREMRFAVKVGRASVGAMARHISGAYSIHVRRRHGWTGSVFNHYLATPVDAELFLDDLVIWLHRPSETGNSERGRTQTCWTADRAYLVPNTLAWITTEHVLAALSPGGAGRSVYRRRKTQPISPEVVAILTGRAARRARHARLEEQVRDRPPCIEPAKRLNIEKVAQFAAEYCQVSFEDLRSTSRRRVISKAKAIAAVLSARNGASVAAVARLFGRSRSTLIERANRYRETQPGLFTQAEQALGTYIDELARMDSARQRTP
jgi:transposase-like protein